MRQFIQIVEGEDKFVALEYRNAAIHEIRVNSVRDL
jgi:hypothetical protein